MESIMIDIINDFGYFGVTFLIAIENVFPPIPSEIILTFGGFLTTISDLNVWGVIIAATIGAVLGALVLYGFGRLISKERLERFFESRLGKTLRLKKEDVHNANVWFTKHGSKTVFFCRFVPLVRSLISIPAGSAKMKLPKFLLLTTTGTAIWNTVLVFLGKAAGEAWEDLNAYLDLYSYVAIAVFAVICLAILIYTIKKKK